MIIAVAVFIHFLFFGSSGVASNKGAYRALFKVRCLVADRMAKVPLGALDERSTGEIKTVLNEDIEKLELFLAHSIPELICYLVGPVTVFIYLMTVNVPLALISLIPLLLAFVIMLFMFIGASGMMERANRSVANLNSVMVEYIGGMNLIKAYNMGSKSFQKFATAVKEENDVWNLMSKKMGPFYAAFIVAIECGMMILVPLGGLFFMKGSITVSVFLMFAFVGSIVLYEVMKMLWKGNTDLSRITRLSIFLAVIFILRIVIYSIGYTESKIGGAAVSRNVRLFLGDKLKKIPLSKFTKEQTGQYINVVTNDVNNYEKILTHTVGDLVKNAAFSVMLVLFVGYVWLTGGIILACVEALLVLFLWLAFRVARIYGTEKNRVCAENVSSIVEYVAGIQTFRAYGVEELKIRL